MLSSYYGMSLCLSAYFLVFLILFCMSLIVYALCFIQTWKGKVITKLTMSFSAMATIKKAPDFKIPFPKGCMFQIIFPFLSIYFMFDLRCLNLQRIFPVHLRLTFSLIQVLPLHLLTHDWIGLYIISATANLINGKNCQSYQYWLVQANTFRKCRRETRNDVELWLPRSLRRVLLNGQSMTRAILPSVASPCRNATIIKIRLLWHISLSKLLCMIFLTSMNNLWLYIYTLCLMLNCLFEFGNDSS